MVVHERKRNFLVGLIFILPIFEQIVNNLDVNISGMFLLDGLIGLLLLFGIFINDISELDQWFLERATGALTLSLAILNSGNQLGFFAFTSQRDLFQLGIVAYTLSMYFLERHFNIKNILLIALNMNALANFMTRGSSILIMIISIAALAFYFEKFLITHTEQFRILILITYLVTILISIVWFVPAWPLFRLRNSNWVIEAIALLAIVPLAYFLMSMREKVRINTYLVVATITYLIIGEVLLVVAQPQILNIPFLLLVFLVYLSLVNIFGNTLLDRDHRKISVIIPTYNSADTIVQTIQSIKIQTYSNWEAIIVDDGSSDDTQNVVKRYLKYNELPVKYIKQENQDQLNAVKHGLKYVTGDICYILHSDDVLYDKNVFYRAVAALCNEKSDGIFIGIQEIDGEGRPGKIIRTKSYYASQTTVAKTALAFGRNPYVDFTYWRRDVFEKSVYENYLTNNLPAWYNSENNAGLRVVNSNFIGLKYRVFEGNYLNSADGSVNVLSGELRTLHHILGRLSIPAFKYQSLFYRAMNKFALSSLCPVIFKQGRTSLKNITPAIVSRRVKDLSNPYVKAIVDFTQNYNPQKSVKVEVPAGIKIFAGADIRSFNRQLSQNTLDPFYFEMMDIIGQGNGTMYVSKKDKQKLENVLEFFTIRDYVKVEVK